MIFDVPLPWSGILDPVATRNLRAFAFFAALVTPLHAETVEAPPASAFRAAFIAQCISERGSSTDAEEAHRSCGCAFDVVAKSMTLQEFIEMDSAGRRGGDPERFPQYVRIKSDLEPCKLKRSSTAESRSRHARP